MEPVIDLDAYLDRIGLAEIPGGTGVGPVPRHDARPAPITRTDPDPSLTRTPPVTIPRDGAP